MAPRRGSDPRGSIQVYTSYFFFFPTYCSRSFPNAPCLCFQGVHTLNMFCLNRSELIQSQVWQSQCCRQRVPTATRSYHEFYTEPYSMNTLMVRRAREGSSINTLMMMRRRRAREGSSMNTLMVMRRRRAREGSSMNTLMMMRRRRAREGSSMNTLMMMRRRRAREGSSVNTLMMMRRRSAREGAAWASTLTEDQEHAAQGFGIVSMTGWRGLEGSSPMRKMKARRGSGGME